MEGLAPPMQLLIHVRQHLERGLSLKAGLRSYFAQTQDEYADQVRSWFLLCETKQDTKSILHQIESSYRRELLRLFERGLDGAPILSALKNFEIELQQACEIEIQNKLADLPYLALIPLLVFQFPAFLMLILGPVLMQLLDSLKP